MPKPKKSRAPAKATTAATVGYEAELWQMADALLEPYQGRVYDPCCGSSGMFVQSIEFIRAHAKRNGNGGTARADISIYGQESNYTTWRLAKMNLAIRGIEGQIAHGDTFHADRFPDLRAGPPSPAHRLRRNRASALRRWEPFQPSHLPRPTEGLLGVDARLPIPPAEYASHA
jgi:hypothetical protein